MGRESFACTTILTILACGPSDFVELRDELAGSLRLSPETIQIHAGSQLPAEAVALDDDGVAVESAPTSWATDDPGMATASPTGFLSGRAAGRTRLRAAFGRLTAAARVIVADSEATGEPDNPPDTTETERHSECEQPVAEWIWCDDFEESRLQGYFEYNDASGSFVRRHGVGVDGSHGMTAAWSSDQVSAGWLHLGVGRTPDRYRHSVGAQDRDLRRLFWRFYLRYQTGWNGGGAAKLSRAFVFHNADHWGQAMIAHVWSSGEGARYLAIDPASGTNETGTPLTTKYNDFDNLRWLGLVRSNTPIFDDNHVGKWYCIEAEVLLNDPSSSNGVFRLWIDDNLEAERTDLNWVGSYDDYGINAVYLENFWNEGSPADQERYFDNFVVSTERIGCL